MKNLCHLIENKCMKLLLKRMQYTPYRIVDESDVAFVGSLVTKKRKNNQNEIYRNSYSFGLLFCFWQTLFKVSCIITKQDQNIY
jgi:hypothetical protein